MRILNFYSTVVENYHDFVRSISWRPLVARGGTGRLVCQCLDTASSV
jgi:hypothetical protein